MAEYIERDKVLAAIQSRKSPARSPAQNEMLRTIRVDVNHIPAADVVEVVRCCDCVWYNNRMCYHPRFEEVCEIPPTMLDFDYCRYGARMDGE